MRFSIYIDIERTAAACSLSGSLNAFATINRHIVQQSLTRRGLNLLVPSFTLTAIFSLVTVP